jgi:hypothetical protein
MAFTRNTNRVRVRATRDLLKKMRLEPRFAKDMGRILRSMVDDFQATYPTDKDTIMPKHYEADVTGALREHYRRVSSAFSYSARNELDNPINEKAKNPITSSAKVAASQKVTSAVKAKMGSYILQHSEKQAKIIVSTTQDDLDAAIKREVTSQLQSGNVIDSHKIAKIVADDYKSKISGRAKMISVTETQSISEKTKDVELDELSDADEDTGRSFSRVWVSVLDERTRDWHAEADGQEVGADEPFIVNGEELDYPGDPNGSPENIINCRCVSLPIET